MPSNEVTLKIEPEDIVKRITSEMVLLLELKPSKRIPVRIRLAIALLRLANWVGDFGGVEVNFREAEPEDDNETIVSPLLADYFKDGGDLGGE